MKTVDYRNTLRQKLYKDLHKFTDQKDWEKYYDNQCSNLLAFMEKKNTDLKIYESGKNKAAHQHFWEVFIGNTLADAELDVKRDCRSGAPDFFLEINGIKIHIDAKAPTEGIKEDLKPKGIKIHDFREILEGNSFEAGFITGEKSILRFTSTLNNAIKHLLMV